MTKPITRLRKHRRSTPRLLWLPLVVLTLMGVIALSGVDATPSNAITPTPVMTPTTPTPIPYTTTISYDPTAAKYFSDVNATFGLNPAELALFKKNGLVVSDRIGFKDFTTAYAYIYHHDLPVLITSDSMLEAVHQTYDDLLKRTETTILRPALAHVIQSGRISIESTRTTNSNQALNPLYNDVYTYWAVGERLLGVSMPNYMTGANGTPPSSPDIDHYVDLAQMASNIQDVGLFGSKRPVDFTQFQPRGHYSQTLELQQYFRAMMWFSQVDFRFVDYKDNQPQVILSQIASAAILQKSVAQDVWTQMDNLLRLFVGDSDNITLPNLERFLTDARIASPADALAVTDPDRLLKMLESGNYGQQRITSQVLIAANDAAPTARPVSFMLYGQRYVMDSEIMGNLIFDRLKVDGNKVTRSIPSPLDVMYSLGNDRALAHLQPEIAKYKYQPALDAERQTVSKLDLTFWQQSDYNRWLNLLRTLNTPSTSEKYPEALRTDAWADKMLHTQLASYAQLRHDNQLYAKFDMIVSMLCSYPAGYVEPYPDFYAALREYADAGLTAFTNMDMSLIKDAEMIMSEKGIDGQPIPIADRPTAIRETIITYYTHLSLVAAQLQTMAEKELRSENFSPAEERFLRNTIISREYKYVSGCTMITAEERHGWYYELFPWKDQSPALISDIFTNANNDPSSPLYPPRVLHVASGNVVAQILTVKTDEGVITYVGPAFTYYEIVQEGYPPRRLNDMTWDVMVNGNVPVAAPSWTSSFRVPAAGKVKLLQIPEK